jgi:predicted dehydrogenase
MTRLRAAVVGLGVGMQHARGLEVHPACDLVALCDRDPDKRAEAAAAFPQARLFDSADALLDTDFDLVCIASYDADHAGQILRALQDGRHVFAEKPLTTRFEDTAAIRAALSANPGVRLSSNTVLRLSPRFVELHADIRAGRLGEIYAVEGDYNYGRLWKLTEGWRGRDPDYSVILGGGIHMADLVLWLTGDRVVEVFAAGTRIASRSSAFPGDDTAMALLRFSNGAIGKLSSNYGCVEPHFHRLLVYGTEATFENGRESARLWHSRDPAEAPETIRSAYPGVAKYALLTNFVDTLLGTAEPVLTEEEVFAAMELCHAIDRSRLSGKPEPVADVSSGAGARRC